MLLDTIRNVGAIRKFSLAELTTIAGEVRDCIINTVSKNGGHLASSLGVVELTLALHYVYNTPIDRIIWDVGHQTYAHKIITSRKSRFHTIRQFNGLSGFPKVSESAYDTYNSGHSSTSLSLAIGEAVARDLNRENYKILAVIGDGSLTGGMAFEALNQIGDLQKDVTIILNDNDHSISKNVGALSEYLTTLISGNFYNSVRTTSHNILNRIPVYGKKLEQLVGKTEANIKGLLVPGHFFEDLGIRYFGPVDGHNIDGLVALLKRLKTIKGPKIVHVITQKGKGYKPSEVDPSSFHGVRPFEKETGRIVCNSSLSYSEVFGRTLVHMAEKDPAIVAVTAAMKSGTGLDLFAETYTDRFFDVGIAEQHAVTFSVALAKNKLKPFVAIYSTFLQRAYDQLIHDAGIMNVPVKIIIDRAGIVGADGETHHGLFDIGFIKSIPNFIFLSPANAIELRDMLYYAWHYNEGPIAIRFPKGCTSSNNISFSEYNEFIPGKIKIERNGEAIALCALGDMVQTALQAAEILESKNISAAVVNLRSIKPLDIEGIARVLDSTGFFITLENGYIAGGIGETILAKLEEKYRQKYLFSVGFPDEFIIHGTHEQLCDAYDLSPLKIATKIESMVHR